jgi:hypothetical protein
MAFDSKHAALISRLLLTLPRNGTIRAHLTRKAKARASLEDVRDSFQETPRKTQEASQETAVEQPNKQTSRDGYQIADVLYLRCKYKSQLLFFVIFHKMSSCINLLPCHRA